MYDLTTLATDMSNVHTAMTEDTGKAFATQVLALTFKFSENPAELGKAIMELVSSFQFGE